MSESWTWRYEDPDGEPMNGPELVDTPFPTQTDAETWLGEAWQDLAENGVDQVTLYHGDQLVYGPMSLRSLE